MAIQRSNNYALCCFCPFSRCVRTRIYFCRVWERRRKLEQARGANYKIRPTAWIIMRIIIVILLLWTTTTKSRSLLASDGTPLLARRIRIYEQTVRNIFSFDIFFRVIFFREIPSRRRLLFLRWLQARLNVIFWKLLNLYKISPLQRFLKVSDSNSEESLWKCKIIFRELSISTGKGKKYSIYRESERVS